MLEKKLRVLTVVGTRPEIIRLSRVIAKLDEHCEHILVHTGQNYDYELNEIFFTDLGVRKPDHFLNAAGKNAAETIGKIIAACDDVLDTVQPEALLVLGDTNSCLSVIAAKRRKIPIFHMEAGNRCFDQRVPEEINRKIIDHTADINLTYSTIAREYLLREGLPPDRVIKTGSPMFEVLNHYMPSIEKSDVLSRFGLEPRRYFVVSAHREENIEPDVSFKKLVETLNAIAERYAIPLIVSAHPRTRKRIDAAGLPFHPLINISKPLGFFDYVNLQQNARVVLSDSGTISEEASILNFPALNIREAHERPEGMEEAAVVMTGLSQTRILQALDVVEAQHSSTGRAFRLVSDYNVPNVADKVVRIIYSYTDYVNRIVWRTAE
ncbi:UDP-N-acetylglucosamine 2-epimerase (non-hydrolyzing) [Rhizobium ruizarguesonis]|jgi:UDP-N-acetylglucosamine 2-epimerase (non-hydrolysing)|uniref:UDP-N-acetylglucosamine 2-epimerase (Non-hydrolyzing) n=1 Tax=Rhizobium leguminosarum TaxID=384 RepID=A0ABD7PMP2_RHILE|nr:MULTISPECIES: UDP-N-acetylglucosamine 2-epimerase (non-hydrolyzing) [Rhizobium]MBY2934818.1 UDP-N-acetylglucosamine 2-epimerase (non-hydrolyzing) [Rhizobium leguminosarum]MBY2964033.1 UDP-N-acetylglucosamine 2-epimerase (non-hydrolyzing) [Rhizobium leguminosarum]MBY2992584.1 UDP-N-acetylglucosamine 2-epimerase (non-hydrolyzing) [Rhizobium leguminosarum]MBY3057863.1 UDP-N-acetylglucosamine 2-epimerase (non-hydrolyzing) [Rhizobium leguminosarum]TAV14334.1 UDP-N-acetylglucosamine 2-epimerase (